MKQAMKKTKSYDFCIDEPPGLFLEGRCQRQSVVQPCVKIAIRKGNLSVSCSDLGPWQAILHIFRCRASTLITCGVWQMSLPCI